MAYFDLTLSGAQVMLEPIRKLWRHEDLRVSTDSLGGPLSGSQAACCVSHERPDKSPLSST
jgi:hypothetical protein